MGAELEEVHGAFVEVGDHQADVGGELIDCAQGMEDGVGLGASFSSVERCCALVSRAGVNFHPAEGRKVIRTLRRGRQQLNIC